ncbi:MAG TPA: hypothetical protein VM598_02455, partial [Bdellovibrionota bacterium]|nr:hypothetical protein [Bdellovibrionota bacterium]
MNLNANDPRNNWKITAYALGELNEREKQEVELELVKNPALAREVGFIRAMAGVLSEELKNEPVTALKPEQRARVTEGRKTAGEWFAAFWAQFKPVGYAMAGIGAVGFLALFTLTPNFQKYEAAGPRTQSKTVTNEKADAPAPALRSEQESQAGAPMESQAVDAKAAKEEKDVASRDEAADMAPPAPSVQLAAPAMKKSLSGATAGVRSDFYARGKGIGSAAEGYGRHNLLPQGFVAP